MSLRSRTLRACGAAVLGLVLATAGHAVSAPMSLTNHLNFSGAVRLPGVTLARGTYTFELLRLQPDIVRVLSRDGSKLYFTGFVQEVRRPAGLGPDSTIALEEAPRGVAPRIQAWYPVGSATGHQFTYPDR